MAASSNNQKFCMKSISRKKFRSARTEPERNCLAFRYVQVLAYKQVDVEYRPERIRVLSTEHTINQLQDDFAHWADASVPPHCLDLMQNLTISGTGSNASQSLQPNQQQQEELADCFSSVSSNLGGLTSLVLSGAQKFIDRNG